MQSRMDGTTPPFLFLSPLSLSPLSHLPMDLLLLRPIHLNRQNIVPMMTKYGFIVYNNIKRMIVP